MSADNSDEKRLERRARLQEYYKAVKEEAEAAASKSCPEPSPPNKLDINSSAFDSDSFVKKIVKEASLPQLLAQEEEIVRQIQTLDSDMQTLVYENYNKFILATDTIQNIRVDFRDCMESKMEQLVDKMQNVVQFSSKISDTLKDSRAEISKLSSTHTLLKKLQFLLDLPVKLKRDCIESSDPQDWSKGVNYYLKAQKVLYQYKHVPSFDGIKEDCESIIDKLKIKLMDYLKNGNSDLNLAVNLCLKLNQSKEKLSDLYLKAASEKLQGPLSDLRVHSEAETIDSSMDILRYIDLGCNTFIDEVCTIVTSYNEAFGEIDESVTESKLSNFVSVQSDEYLNLISMRLSLENNLDETPILVRALDRFHRKLQAMNRLVPSKGLNQRGLDIILDSAERSCNQATQIIKEKLIETVTSLRFKLADSTSEPDLNVLNCEFISSLDISIKSSLEILKLFIDPESAFGVKTYVKDKFGKCLVLEKVIMVGLREVLEYTRELCDGKDKSLPPHLLLLLSKSIYHFKNNNLQGLFTLVESEFYIVEKADFELQTLQEEYQSASQNLLDSYVRLGGRVLSIMIRKSVETRDWLNTVEPRSVRAVMKRIIEEINSMNKAVEQLYEDDVKKAPSSDSSRKTKLSTSRIKIWSDSGLDTSLASNIQKMFTEKITVFSTVEFSQISVLTGIIKIALKTLLECIRLRTFSRFGFQQLQVDCHYLNMYLWRFVSDESMVTFMIDEVMTSSVHRCLDPIPMEHSIVEVICDKS